MSCRAGCAGAGVLIAVISVVFVLDLAHAQQSPRVGVALSGGGARGFAHIGVLRVLEEEGVPIDVIAGSSIGSIIGGLYAIGYSPDDLERIGRAQNWDELFVVSSPRSRRPVRPTAPATEFIFSLAIRDGKPALPSSLVSGQQISKLLARLTLPFHGTRDFRQLPIPFAAVATDLETGEAIRLDEGHLAEAIRASVSIPTALAPVEIDGHTLIDGGIARNLPAEDARALGADVVLCIDTSRDQQRADSLEAITEVLNQVIGFRIEEKTDLQKRYCDVYLRPWLGNTSVTDFGSIDDMIRQGYASADSARAQLRALGGGRIDRRDTTAVVGIRDTSYSVRRVRVAGVASREERRIIAAMRLPAPGDFSLAQIEAAIDRVYASGPYRQVIYRLLSDSTGPGSTLLLDVNHHDEGRLGIDLRYDSRYKTSLLIGAAGLKRVGYGPTVRAALRLGEIATLDAGYLMPLSYRHPLSLNIGVEWVRAAFDQFEDGERRQQFQIDAVRLRAFIGIVPVGRWSVSAGAHVEYFGVDQRIGSADFFRHGEAALGPEAAVNLDTHDRSSFPSRGHRVHVKALAAIDPASGETFSRLFADWQPRWPVTDAVTLTGRISLGTSSGELPLHHRFSLGGAFEQPVLQGRIIPLRGASTQELSGRHLQAFAAGVQLRLNDDWFVSGAWNAGSAGSTWKWPGDDFRPGFGFSIGRLTWTVPAVLTLSARNPVGPYDFRLNLGHIF